MKGQNIGYIRISTLDQKYNRQLEGIELDDSFIDMLSGKDTNREQLDAMRKYVRKGDKLFVHSMDRLARNVDDLRKIVKELNDKGVEVHFVKENLIFNGHDSPVANLMLSIMGSFAEFERELMLERQREGIALAKQRGAYKGRKPCFNDKNIIEIKKRVEQGYEIAKIARDFGVSRVTIYKYIKNNYK